MSWLVLAVVLAGHPAGLHLGSPAIHPSTACCVIGDVADADPGDLLAMPPIAGMAGAMVAPRALLAGAAASGRHPVDRPTARRVPPSSSDDEPPQRSA